MRVKFVTVLVMLGVLLLVIPAVAGAKGMTSPYKCTLTSVNGSQTIGAATLVCNMRNGSLRVNLNVWGLERASDKEHCAAITGFADGRMARLPNPTSDTNHDGLISGPEVAAVSGSPLVWLKPWPVAKRNGRVTYCVTLSGEALTPLDLANTALQTRAIVIYGVTQQPTYTLPFYDPDAPTAVGVIRSLN
jgi:hypothetical protein